MLIIRTKMGYEMPQEIERETRDFARAFFDIAVEKVREAGAPEKEYPIPAIIFADERPLVLSSMRSHTEEPGKTISRRNSGNYDSNTHTVSFNKTAFKDGVNYHTIGHELMHALYRLLVGNQIFEGYNELQKMKTEDNLFFSGRNYELLPTEVADFTAELEDIVMELHFPDKRKDSPDKATMSKLRAVHARLKDGAISYMEKTLEKYKQFVRAFAALPPTARPGEVKERSEFYNMGLDWLSDEVNIYLQTIGGVKLLGIQTMCQSFIRFAEKPMKDHAAAKSEAETFSQLKRWYDTILSGVSSNGLRTIDYRRQVIYAISKLAIEENREQLKTSWPKVMMMPGMEIDRMYTGPVRREIEAMKSEYCFGF